MHVIDFHFSHKLSLVLSSNKKQIDEETLSQWNDIKIWTEKKNNVNISM